MASPAQRYTAVAIVLHWAIAFAILFMLPLGFWMHIQAEHGEVSQRLYDAYQLHKSIGLTVLALSLVRLAWRLLNPPPPLPGHMPGWEKLVARATHWAFYGLMIGLPLSGWLYVSAGWSIHDDNSLAVATHWFGFFQVPDLFNLAQASNALRRSVAEGAFTAHWVLAYAAIGLAALHVAAALKHHFFDKDETLAHMVPGVRAPFETETPPKNPIRMAVLGAGFALIAIAAATALYAVASLGPATAQGPASTFDVVEEAALDAEPMAPAATVAAEDEEQPGATPTWSVDQRASAIEFSYVFADESGESRFNGRFTGWRADIRFDPNNLDASTVVVRIDTRSARTGVAAHDNALPEPGWFNAAAHPTAEFRSTRIRSRGEGQYEARGDLTIKGENRQVDLPFTLSITGDRASVSGTVTIDRRQFGVGEGAAADELISNDIDISVRVEASRAP